MLKRVEPLRDELYSLERQAETNKLKGEEVKNLITQLERSIASYKEEYAQLISQAQAIKADLESVQAKVNRSIALLKSLVIERERWEATSETFKSQMSTIIGDVLLSSAFLAYAGYFDQHVSFRILFTCFDVTNLYVNLQRNAFISVSSKPLHDVVSTSASCKSAIQARYRQNGISVQSGRTFEMAGERVANRRSVHRERDYVEALQQIPVDH